MADKFVFSKVASSFLISLLFISLFSVGVYAQEDVVADEPVAEGDSSDGSIPSGDFNDIRPVPAVYVCGDREHYDFINGECRAPEVIGEVESPGFFEGMFRGMRYFLSNDEAKARLTAKIGAEKLTELESALGAGDYEAVRSLAEEFSQEMARAGEVMTGYMDNLEGSYDYDEFQNGEGEFNDFFYTKRMYIQNIGKLDEIKGTILEKIDAGETTHVAVEGIFDALNNEGEVIAKIEKIEDEFVDKVAEEGGVTELEIEYAIEKEDKEIGITENYYQNYDSQDYAETMGKLDALRTEITASDKLYSREVESLFDEARLRAQLSQTEIQNGHYSDGYNEFYKSKYIMYNLENYLDEGERALNKIDESVAVGPVELNKEIEGENKQFVEEYAQVKEIIAEKYPEEVKNLDASYIVAQDVVALSEKINEVAEQELTKLEEAGKTEEEAREIIEEKKAEEYYYNYGGKYSPPGYIEVSSDDETGEIDYNYGGGYAKRYDYFDGADNVDYRFGDNGYSWETWTGEKYSTPHPADYEPERVKRGDEVSRTEVETEDGTYNYEYYATGYKTIAPDGTETENLYSDTADKIQFTGGTFVDYEPTGYVVTYQGDAQIWYGNPVFDNYINAVDGKVFTPEVSLYKDVLYKPEEKVYEYTYEDVKWAFDPATKVWTNDITKEAVPTNAPDAPMGHEGEKEYITEDGTEWTYEENAEKFAWHWKGTDGIEGYYVPALNNYYYYDKETGKYIDIQQEMHDEAEYAGEKWEVSNNVWISEKGTTYNTKTGDTYIQVGDAIVLASELEDIESGGFYNYGRMYDADRKEIRSYTYNTGSYAWDPRTNNYGYYSEYGLANYDPANPTKHELKDAQGNIVTTWVQDKDGRWRTEGSVGNTGYFGYERYSAYPTGTPATGGKSYPGYYGGYYDSTTGSYVGATGCSGGCRGDFGYGTSYYGGSYSNNLGHIQSQDGTWRPATSQAEADAARLAGTYSAPGTLGYPPSTGATGYLDSSYIAVTGTSPGGYDATTGTSGYYSNGVWVSTPSTNYGGSYASYYGSYAGSGAAVGITTVYNGQTYTVDAVKGWTNALGEAVAPPPGYASSATGYSGGTSYSSGGYYSGGTWVSSGGYVAPTSGGYYDQTGTYVPSTGTYSPGYYDSSGAWVAPSSTTSGTYPGSYVSPGYYDSTGTYVPSTGTYAYSGGYDPAAAAAGWPGGAYPGGVAPYSGPYTGPVGGSGGSGQYAYGSAPQYGGSPEGSSYGGSTGGGTGGGGGGTGGTSYGGGGGGTGGESGGSPSGGGESSGGSTGGSGGGSTGGGGEGGGGTGGVIAEEEAQLDNWFVRFFRRLFGRD